MKRGSIVFVEVDALYREAETSMGKWMWHNHTQWVADKAKQLAEKYDADIEKVYCAALLHDVADSKYERNDERFDDWSKSTAKKILLKAKFNTRETREILEAIRTHSCHPGALPTILEGQVLATADGMWHLQTNFFSVICYMNRPEGTKSYGEWQAWFKQKVKRDFNVKIFFQDERAEVKADYAALLRVFGDNPFTVG